MESIVVAIITEVITPIGVILSNSKSRVVIELKIYALAEKVAKHNQPIERTYEFEFGLAIVQNNVRPPKRKAK